MEHSKGPWETDGRVSPAGAGYLDIVCPKGRIAMMDCENDAFWDAELEANAALIVAAPDMLAALEQAYQQLNTWMNDDKWDDEDEAVMEQIWAAISKAKGAD